MARTNDNIGPQSFEECWDLLHEMTGRFHVTLTVQLLPNAPRNARDYTPMSVLVIAHTLGKKPRALCQKRVAVSTVSGALTTPAALHRALSEVYWYLDDAQDWQATQRG